MEDNKVRTFILAAALLIAPARAGAQECRDVYLERWRPFFLQRVQALEYRNRVSFDWKWKPQVECDPPADRLPPDVAAYDYVANKFYVNPDTLALEPSKRIVDHELAHALTDQIRRRNGLGALPANYWIHMQEPPVIHGLQMTYEGIADYYESSMQKPDRMFKRFGVYLLPVGRRDLDANSKFMYEWGEWMVRPIIARYGERGIVYISEAPYVLNPDNVRESARLYQQKTLAKLESQERNSTKRKGARP